MKANQADKLRNDEQGLMFNMLITAGMSIVIFFALMNIGVYINGQISSSLIESYPEFNNTTAPGRTALQNATVNSLQNISADYDSVLDIMTVTAIIMVITLPLAAVIGVRKLI